MCSSWKRYFPKACSEALHGSAVTGVTFFVAGQGFSGFSCSAGVRAVVLFKRCLMPYCPPHIASWLFCLFSHWTLTDWHLSLLAYESNILHVEPSLQLWIIILYFFHLEAMVLHIFDCAIAYIVTHAVLIIELIKSDCKYAHRRSMPIHLPAKSLFLFLFLAGRSPLVAWQQDSRKLLCPAKTNKTK